MISNESVVFSGALATRGHQPLRRQTVLLALVPLEHAVVGNLVQEMVLEHVLADTLERAGVTGAHQIASHQDIKRLRRSRSNMSQRLVPEHMADHAGLLQRSLRGGRQPVEAGLQHPGQRRRHPHFGQVVGGQPPLVPVGGDDTVIDQHGHQLFEEIRVAFGISRQHVTQ